MRNLILTLLIGLISLGTALAQGNSSNNGNGNNTTNGNPGGPRTNILLPFGNVGIGTLVPQQKLHVIGQSLFDGNMDVIGIAAISLDVRVGRNLLVDGNTGLGTQTPQARFHVVGNSIFDGNIQLNGTGRVTEDFEISRDLFVDRNVGIGIRAPQAKLHLVGNSIFDGDWNLNGTGNVSKDFTVDQQFNVNGNSGFGVASPQERVEVEGNMRVSQTIFADRIEVKSFQAEDGEFSNNLNVGNQFTVGGMSGFGVQTPTERIDVAGNVKVTEGLISNTVDTKTFTADNGTFNQNLKVTQNLNVDGLTGLGVASPTEKLEVSGNAKISQKVISDELATRNALISSNLGIGNVLTVDGNTGLGVSTPTERLEVAGNIVATDNITSNGLQIQNGNTANDFTIGNILSVNGNTGLGVTDPTERLEVEGNAKISNKLYANAIESQNFTVENATVNNQLNVNGNTGLGVISPTQRLDVAGNIKASQALMASSLAIQNGEVSSNLTVGNIFSVSGNTGLGVTAPTERLDVAGNVRVSNTLYADAIESNEFTVENSTVNNLLSVGGNAIINGRIGLGVSAPTVKLDVAGNIKASGNITANNVTANTGTFSGSLSATNNLAVSGTSNLTGKVTTNAMLVNGLFEVKNNANIVGTLGIGIGTPEATLHVAGDGKFDGTVTAVKLIVDELEVANVDFGSASTTEDVNFNKDLFVEGSVGIGSQKIDGYKLSVNGKIRASDDIKVYPEAQWADYVFEDDYALRSLEDVESYIKENNHLPNVPSATQVKKSGIELGAMDAKLLEKIEELTLYMIALKKQNDLLQSEVEALKKSVNK